MANDDKHYFIYLRSRNERIPVSKQQFKDYYRDIDTYRKRQQRIGKCVCPKNMELACDMDCETCPYHHVENQLSLDYLMSDSDGHETVWSDTIADDSPLIDDLYVEASELKALYQRLMELMPEAADIGRLRLSGKNDRDIEREIGTPRRTFECRIESVRKRLQKEFPDFF